MTIEQFLWTVPFVALGIAIAGLVVVYLTKPRNQSDPRDSHHS